jgi:iron complex outermembrane recepter protein
MKKHQAIKRALAATVCAVVIATAAMAQDAQFNIPAGSLKAALDAYIAQTGAQLIFRPQDVAGRQTRGVSGEVSLSDALEQILAGTGLSVQRDASGAMVIKRADPVQQQDDGAEASPLQEVIVTATKRPEEVRKISGSVTAVTGQDMERIGAQSMQDYLTFVPGVQFNDSIPGTSTVVIRGVSDTTGIDQGQGSTGYFIDDVPLTDPYFAVAIPDIDAFDVDNVTVLRGPQGTLFGSASLGGAVDYQAARPNLSAYQAHLEGTVGDVEDGAVGGSDKIMVNTPIVPGVLAVRGVFVYRDDAGFIDNIGTGQKNSNTTLVRGGRLEATWKPADATTFNYLFLDQTEDTEDNGIEEPAFGPLEKDTLIPEPYDFKTLIHNLRLDQDLGFATLTATATFHEKDQDGVTDDTANFGRLLPGVSPIEGLRTDWSRGTTFEVRLASPAGQRFEYLIGAMHDLTHEYFDTTYEGANAAQAIDAVYSAKYGAGIGQLSATPGGVFFTGLIPFEGQESAVFGEATYHFNDQWKLTLGGREFYTQSNNKSIESGFFDLLTSGQLATSLAGKQSEDGFTPKASLTWTPDSDYLVYALMSKGFRFGGPNISASEPGFTIPKTFGSDSLWNYELGARSDWFDHRLLLDGDVFYIDWSNIQLRLESPARISYGANAGRATNEGFEGTGTWGITRDLTLQTNLTYLHAVLDTTFNPGDGAAVEPAGTELPGTAKWQVSNIVSYGWPDGPGSPIFTVAQRYISARPGNFSGGVPTAGYDTVDSRATFALRDNLDLTVFVQNIGDVRGITSASTPPLEEYLIRPRTFGITLDLRL